MDREKGLALLKAYAKLCSMHTKLDYPVYTEIHLRFPEDGDDYKLNRWIGFMQGALHFNGVKTLDNLKVDSLSLWKPEEKSN